MLLDGRYQLLRSLGSGGMGEVWLARLLGPDGFEKLVAVKLAHPDLSAQESFQSLFVEEAKVAARMRHPNVAQVFDFGRAGERCFLVMEYVDGASLRVLVDHAARTGRPVPVGIACWVVAELLRGLHSVHESSDRQGHALGAVHRDVSPANCMVSMDGGVKLIDFGIVKLAAAERTRPSWVKGKIAYMSPEQARGEPLDRRSDIFSAALVLYELLSGQRAYEGDDESAIHARAVAADIPPLARSDSPPELWEILSCALAREPAARPATALELAQALQPFAVHADKSCDAQTVAAFMQQTVEPLAIPPPLPERTGDGRTLEVDIEVAEVAEAPPAPRWGFWLALTLLLSPVVLALIAWGVLRAFFDGG